MCLSELLNCVNWENLFLYKENVGENFIKSYANFEEIPEKYLNAKINENEFLIYNDGLGCLTVDAGLIWI